LRFRRSVGKAVISSATWSLAICETRELTGGLMTVSVAESVSIEDKHLAGKVSALRLTGTNLAGKQRILVSIATVGNPVREVDFLRWLIDAAHRHGSESPE
jgi:hypothetical protein